MYFQHLSTRFELCRLFPIRTRLDLVCTAPKPQAAPGRVSYPPKRAACAGMCDEASGRDHLQYVAVPMTLSLPLLVEVDEPRGSAAGIGEDWCGDVDC